MGQRSVYTLRPYKRGDFCPKCGEAFIKSDGMTIYCQEVGCNYVEPKKDAKTTDNQQLNMKLNHIIRRLK